MPIFEAMNISETHTWVASPMKASLQSSMLLAFGQVLHHGHEVAELLGGMVVARYMPLMTGAGGVLRQVHHVLVAVDAGHEDVDAGFP